MGEGQPGSSQTFRTGAGPPRSLPHWLRWVPLALSTLSLPPPQPGLLLSLKSSLLPPSMPQSNVEPNSPEFQEHCSVSEPGQRHPGGPSLTPRDKADRGRLASVAPAGAQHSLTPDLMLPLPCLPPEGSTSHAQQLLGQTTHRLL